MYSSKGPGVTERDEEKIVLPTCVHPVNPIDPSVERTQSQLEKVISAYDHIIDTAAEQLKLLDSVNTSSSVSSSAPSKAVTTQQNPSKKTAPAKSSSAQAAPIKTKFNYEWPSDLKYPIGIAVKVNSGNIPVTPWLFRRIFGPAVHIRLHKHSSFKGNLPNLINDNEREYKVDRTKLIFTVVVHDIANLEFMVDPLRQGVIRDEQNLQRYLLRLLKIFKPMDPIDDASSENYVDLVARDLLQSKQQSRLSKSTLESLDGEVRTRSLLIRSDQPTPADFSLLAATYNHDLKGLSGLESHRSNLESYFNLKSGEKQWFKA